MKAARGALLALLLASTGCATMTASTSDQASSTAVSPERAQARAYEADGRLRQALEAWQIVAIVERGDIEARQAQARIQARIDTLTTERLAAAKAALAKGAPLEARRKLLSVLALDPANATAFKLLQTEAREVETIVHTVRAGETLASLAQRYYGDRARAEVIWDLNQLPANKPLTIGTALRIPEIPGVPFHRTIPRPATPSTAEGPAAPTAPSARERSEAARDEQPPEVNPMLADVREAVERGEFAVALADVDKFIAQNPGQRDGFDIKKLVLYRQGQSQFEDKKYDESFRTLTVLARLQPDYEDLPKLLQQVRKQAAETHYREGIRLYREERLPEAITEWRLVLDFDPQHANARRNIEQAERLLKGLEQRKRR